MASPTSNYSESLIKCLEHIIFNPHKTQRVIQIPDNLEIPNRVKTWKPGGITKACSNLGLTLQDEESLEQQPIIKNNLKRSFPEDGGTQRNCKIKDEDNDNATNSKGEESCKRLGYNNNNNVQSYRTFSPPRQVPKTITNNPNTTTSSNNVNNYSSNKHVRFEDTTQKNTIYATPSVLNQNGHNLDNNKLDCTKESQKSDTSNPFKTAREVLLINDKNNGIKRNLENTTSNVRLSGLTKKLAPSRTEPPSKQSQPPVQKDEEPISDNPEVVELMEHPLMKNIDPKMVEAVLNDMVDTKPTSWNDIAGLEAVKKTIKEIIVWPMQRPDIFQGLRGPPKGTGKTMMGRLIATESESSFFNISASSLTSKWIGDGEKMVRALFSVARVKQPAVIFIDEIDSILTQRSETEHESSRRLKTEFLIQFDGCGTNSEDRILVIGVTNRPQELDEAARRRLVKRIYIPLPCVDGRKQLIQNMLKGQSSSMREDDYIKISELTDGYSGSDISSLCREAAYGPLRDVGVDIMNTCAEELRPMEIRDFEAAMKHVKSSVDKKDLLLYEDWDQKFGCLNGS